MLKIGNIEFNDFPLLLAPMEDITDTAFRSVCKPFGADLMFTEFISSEGLIRDVEKSTKKLIFSEEERPIGIQIFGNNVESMKTAAEMAERANPELIDINFGCAVRKIAKKGCGAGILNDIPKMVEITKEVVKSTKLPVTVKTRLGWDENNKDIVEITERLQDVGIQAITIHGRTKAQKFKDKADWTLIGEVKNNPRIKIPVIGNGDIDNPEEALLMKNKYGIDAIMIGRACIGNPWIFREIKHFFKHSELLPPPEINEKVKICREHLKKTIKVRGEKLGILALRRHYSNYFKAIPDFKQYRLKLVTLDNFDEVNAVLDEIQNKFA